MLGLAQWNADMVTNPKTSPRLAKSYQIIVEGKIDPSWSEWLGGMQATSQRSADGLLVTILTGSVRDQSALRGLLNRLWDLNLVLRLVKRIDPGSELEP